LSRVEVQEIARGLKKNVWNKEFRLRAMAVVIQTAKQRDPALNDYEMYKEAGLLPDQNGSLTGEAA
jgi:hypothetical protein